MVEGSPQLWKTALRTCTVKCKSPKPRVKKCSMYFNNKYIHIHFGPALLHFCMLHDVFGVFGTLHLEHAQSYLIPVIPWWLGSGNLHMYITVYTQIPTLTIWTNHFPILPPSCVKFYELPVLHPTHPPQHTHNMYILSVYQIEYWPGFF